MVLVEDAHAVRTVARQALASEEDADGQTVDKHFCRVVDRVVRQDQVEGAMGTQESIPVGTFATTDRLSTTNSCVRFGQKHLPALDLFNNITAELPYQKCSLSGR